ncbi:MAG: diguanylate cyclase [Proteobacteria bacterium]|nr:diguanylate cyclase [Pseudomonadota bacterium]MBU4099927.1 diguanylate cyclase [Pseudomonadota bacterium]MBU4127230.1 diguanylate cyclase [Pseudomonadota bacterium]MBU4387948.1 diguanylate cyclase [Pseudomonadota bacterium]MCG2830818.1 diguanylate cyclase [Desulfobacteraceae bacterium]
MIFERQDSHYLSRYVGNYNNWLAKNVDDPVRTILSVRPKELVEIFEDIKLLRDDLSKTPSDFIESRLFPLLKKAIIHTRRSEAYNIEQRSGFTFNHNLRIKLENELTPFNNLMSHDWFKNTKLPRFPKLTDFISIQHAETYLIENKKLSLYKRIYDEKFHILNAPSLFLPDLSYYRITCELRDLSLCVAYIDIDDFKQFNTEFGEPIVDRDILPSFMSALEAHVYLRGHAYRYGGDEYVVLLPNMSSLQACQFLESFQNKLESLKFFKINKQLEVSIGILEVSENDIETDREIEEKAAKAKNFAKDNKKNCIAFYKGQEISIYPDKS